MVDASSPVIVFILSLMDAFIFYTRTLFLFLIVPAAKQSPSDRNEVLSYIFNSANRKQHDKEGQTAHKYEFWDMTLHLQSAVLCVT